MGTEITEKNEKQLKELGIMISTCRKIKGLSQKELAEKMNITDRAVSKWETGGSLR